MADLWGPEARERARRENSSRKLGRKKCISCERFVPLEDYYRNARSFDGLRAECIDCFRTWRRRK